MLDGRRAPGEHSILWVSPEAGKKGEARDGNVRFVQKKLKYEFYFLSLIC